MALIALGVTGGIGAYKAVEVARALQKRGHDVARRDDPQRSAVRRPGHLRGDHAAPRDRRASGRPAPTPTSSTSRSPSTSRCCWWRRRRPTSSASSPTASPTTSCHDALPGHARPGAAGARHEHGHVGARGGAAESGDAARARRAGGRAGRRLPRVRVGRQGPDGRAGGDCRRRRGNARGAGRARSPACACW